MKNGSLSDKCESCRKALRNQNVSVEPLEMVQLGPGMNTQSQWGGDLGELRERLSGII